YFPDSDFGTMKVAEHVAGKRKPYPTAAFQDGLETVLGIHIDRQDRLWILDYGQHGVFPAKIYAVDLETDKVVFDYTFSRSIPPIGSMLTDLVIAPDGKTIFISDTSQVLGQQAIVVLDLSGKKPVAHRRLRNHKSVAAGKYDVFVNNKRL